MLICCQLDDAKSIITSQGYEELTHWGMKKKQNILSKNAYESIKLKSFNIWVDIYWYWYFVWNFNVSYEISHKISYTYIEICVFHTRVEMYDRFAGLRAHTCFCNGAQWTERLFTFLEEYFQHINLFAAHILQVKCDFNVVIMMTRDIFSTDCNVICHMCHT